LTVDSISESEKKNATGVYETVLKKFGKKQIERMTQELQQDAMKAASEENFELKRILRESYIRCKDQGKIL
jgi:excinuclease UvrABC nuclease subunit